MTRSKLALILIGGLLITYSNLFAQHKSIINDSIEVNSLITTGNDAVRKLEKNGLENLLIAAKICESKKSVWYTKQHTLALLGIASYYTRHGKYDSCVYYYNAALKLANESKDDLAIARINLGFGNVATYRSDYETAISKNMLALKYFEFAHDSLGVAAARGNIGWAYVRLSLFDKAIDYLNSAIDLYLKKGQITSAANNISNLSGAYKGLNNKQKELELKQKAFSMFKSQKYVKGMATVGMNLGAFYEDTNIDEALKYYDIALKCSWQISDNGNIATLYNSMGGLYLKLNQLDRSEKCIDSAWYFALKSGDRLAQADAMMFKADILHARGQHIKAVDYSKRYIQIRDSIFANKMQSQVADMEVKYETDKKQKQIALLNQQTAIQKLNLKNQDLQLQQNKSEIEQKKLLVDNQQLQLSSKQDQLNKSQLEALAKGQKIKLLNNQNTIQQLEINKRNTTIMIIAALFLLVLITGYQFYSRYKLKQAAVLQAEVMKQQDIATKGIIEAEERERKRIAAELHDGVGQLFTTVKMNMEILMERFLVKQPDADLLAEKTMAMVDESCTEVRSIAHQMMPNALIKSGLVSALRDFINKIPSEKLKISLETKGIDKGLESTTETVLYRVIQESVNNVIKHAEATSLDILLLCDNKEITVSIEDNGKGFSTGDKSKFNGIGLKNMISRVEYLKGSVDISSSPGKGTLVAIFIPLI